MKTVQFMNSSYFFYIIITICMTLGSIFFLRNKSMQFTGRFILTLLLSAFALHFLKLLIPSYRSQFPKIIRKSTFENICAVSTLLFPWFYLVRKKWMMDYMVVMGILSGMIAILVPLEAKNQPTFALDTMRFYFAHIIIFLAPFLIVYKRQYDFNYHRVFKVPFTYYGVLFLIFLNEIFVMVTGMFNENFSTLFKLNGRNPSLIFGPSPDVQSFQGVLNFFVPNFLRSTPTWLDPLHQSYFPILWQVIPAYIFIVLFGLVIGFLFDNQHFKADIKNFFRFGRAHELQHAND